MLCSPLCQSCSVVLKTPLIRFFFWKRLISLTFQFPPSTQIYINSPPSPPHTVTNMSGYCQHPEAANSNKDSYKPNDSIDSQRKLPVDTRDLHYHHLVSRIVTNGGCGIARHLHDRSKTLRFFNGLRCPKVVGFILSLGKLAF